MSSSSADRDMAFTLSSRLNMLQNKGKINCHLTAGQSVCLSVFLTCQLPGTDPGASSQPGPGQSAANGSVCFWVQWTLGFSQRPRTCKPGWYTLRSEGRNRQISLSYDQLWLLAFKEMRVNLHLSGSSGKTWGRNCRTGRLQQSDPKTQRNVSTESCS